MPSYTRPQGAGAILVTPQGDLLLQRKTKDYASVNAGKLTLFGGWIDSGETEHEAILRELVEELELVITPAHNLTTLGVFEEATGKTNDTKKTHVFVVSNVQESTLVLHEGERIERYTLPECLARQDLTPVARITLAAYQKTT